MVIEGILNEPQAQTRDNKFNLSEFLINVNIVRGRGEKIAYRTVGPELHVSNTDYHTLARNTRRISSNLNKIVDARDRVAIVLPDCPEWVCSFLGVIRRGGIAVPLSTMLSPLQYAFFMNDCAASALITYPDGFRKIQQVRDQIQHLKNIFVLEESGARTDSVNYSPFQTLVDGESDDPPFDSSEKDIAFLVYTSGTTGPPKAAAHSHAYVKRMPDTYYTKILGITDHDLIFCTSKLFTAYALGHSLIGTLKFGLSSILLSERATTSAVLQVISYQRPTLLFSVPILYSRLIREVKSKSHPETPSLRLCIVGGEYLPVRVCTEWKSIFGVDLLDGIGSSETLIKVTSNLPGQVKLGSLGKPVDGAGVRIVDEKGTPLKVGEMGFLEVKTEWMFSGYWNGGAAVVRGEWLRLSDICYLDEEGYLYFEGRANDVVKQSGYWVSPHEIEDVLYQHPHVLEVAAAPCPDENGLMGIKAFVVLRDSKKSTDQLAFELREFVGEKLAPYKKPKSVEFVNEIPRSIAGKVKRQNLTESTNAY